MASWYMYISPVLTQVSVEGWWPPGICIFLLHLLRSLWRVDGLLVYVYFSCTYSGLCEGLMASWYMYIYRLLLRSLWRVMASWYMYISRLLLRSQWRVDGLKGICIFLVFYSGLCEGWWPPGICIFPISYSGLCGGLMASWYMYISPVLTQVSVKGWWPPGICIFLLYLPRSLCRADSLQVYVYFCCTYSGLSEGLMASWYMYIARLLLSSLWRVMASWYMYISHLLLRSLWRVDGLLVYVYFSCTYSGLCKGLMASWYMYISPVLTKVSVQGW